ncbi:MAG TPA: hypothetical protein VE153_16870 [Myxococcus sp.]|nr:hypothetical protein [Myxococcus sp.]
MSTEKKTKKVKELFVQDLTHIQGGTQVEGAKQRCPEITTLACGEEGPKCSAC